MTDLPPQPAAGAATIRRVQATEIAPGFLGLAESPRPDLAPLLVAAWKKSGAAAIVVADDLGAGQLSLLPLQLPGILVLPALWGEAPPVCGVVKAVFDGFRPVRAATHPPLLGAILAIRALALGGACAIVRADAAAVPAAPLTTVEAEKCHANQLLALSAVRRDLLAVLPGDPRAASCEALCEAIAEATLETLKSWSHHRSVLWNRDLRATWAAGSSDTT